MTGRVLERAGAIRPALRLRGRLHLPSDKSIAHRALVVNALAGGPATVTLRDSGADLASTIGCLRELGVRISSEADRAESVFTVEGDVRQPEPAAILDCANSGTTMRLLAGAIAGREMSATLDGDASLRRRPMDRIADPLRAMGASVETDGGRPPLRVRGKASLRALTHRLPVASAQLIGGISLAALAADGETRIESPGPTRDHTERLLAWMGVRIRRDGLTTTIDGPARPRARSLRVSGDLSAASAWLVAATAHPDAELELLDVGLNPTRMAIVDILREAGAEIEIRPHEADGPEPTGDLTVRSAARLSPVRIGGERVAALIDELPVLAIIMAAVEDESELRGAGELRVKESDRVAATVRGLAAIGAVVEEMPDGWRVRRGVPRQAKITTEGDHRIAMAFAVAALAGVSGEVTLDDTACVSVSYPSFWRDVDAVRGA